MKKFTILFLTLGMLVSVSACTKVKEDAQNIPEKTEIQENDQEKPILAAELKNGSYVITVDSSSSMFRVVKCELIVEDTEMHAVMTMSGQGYGKLYMGTAEEALHAEESDCIPFEMNADGEKTFTVPVEALDKETDCAAWSIKKEEWYDRVLVFKSDDIPAEAFGKA